jgi:hypothetical protein
MRSWNTVQDFAPCTNSCSEGSKDHAWVESLHHCAREADGVLTEVHHSNECCVRIGIVPTSTVQASIVCKRHRYAGIAEPPKYVRLEMCKFHRERVAGAHTCWHGRINNAAIQLCPHWAQPLRLFRRVGAGDAGMPCLVAAPLSK